MQYLGYVNKLWHYVLLQLNQAFPRLTLPNTVHIPLPNPTGGFHPLLHS
jgi:hypothetical protein